MLSSWFKALRDPTPPASGRNDRDSIDEDSNSKYDSNSGVTVVSLRGDEGGPGQRTNNECGFDGETFVCFTSRRGLNVFFFGFVIVTYME